MSESAHTVTEIFEKQHDNQVNAYHLDPASFDEESRVEFVKTNILAAITELTELLDEHGWKTWSQDYALRDVNSDAVLGESADVMCFLVNVMLAHGLTGEEFAKAYFEKAERNVKRQTKGYDTSSSDWKCSTCGRALDDPGVECTSDECGDR